MNSGVRIGFLALFTFGETIFAKWIFGTKILGETRRILGEPFLVCFGQMTFRETTTYFIFEYADSLSYITCIEVLPSQHVYLYQCCMQTSARRSV